MKKKVLFLTLVCILLGVAALSGCSAPAPTTTAPVPTTAPATSAPAQPTQSAAPKPSASASPAAEAKPLSLKLAFEQAPTSPYYKNGFEPYANSIAKATSNKIKIDLYPNQMIFKSGDAWNGVKSGIADMAWINVGLFTGQFDFVNTITLPYMYSSGDIGSRIVWQMYNKYPEIQQQLSDVKVLTVYTTDPFIYMSSKKNYKTMDDFKGQKIRMISGPPIEMMKNLGGVPVMVQMPDVYLNVQKGVLDGMGVPAEAAVGFRFYEVAPYITYDAGLGVVQMIVMNKDTWNGLPKELQDGLMSVSGDVQGRRFGKEVYDASRQILLDTAKAAGAKLTEYTVPQAEKDKWAQTAGKPVWEAWTKQMEARGFKNVSQMITDIQTLNKQYSGQ